MTPEEMDMAIAKHIGWTAIEDRSAGLMMPNGFSILGYPPKGAVIGKKVPIPRCSEDLNAMHEAEQHLFTRYWDARDIFIDRLCRIMDPVSGYRKQGAIDIIDSTAEQHARAFVETIGQIKP